MKKKYIYYDVKIPMSKEIKSGCIVSADDLADIHKLILNLNITAGAYVAMTIKRDIRRRKEKGTF